MDNTAEAMKRRHPELFVSGLPENLDELEESLCRSRLINMAGKMMASHSLSDCRIVVETAPHPRADGRPTSSNNAQRRADELTIQERARRYEPRRPEQRWENLVLPEEDIEELMSALAAIRNQRKLYEDWGLGEIEPHPRLAINFYGPPGTGKTMAAHALADQLGRPILAVTYADIESKYHCEGPKNLQALFQAAERDQAVLFIDEAESLLSRRLTEVSHSADHAVNALRSQLLIELERFEGVVIFATNMIKSYDKGFLSRLRQVRFSMPDGKCLKNIWRKMLVPKLPLAQDVDVEALVAQSLGRCTGRDVRNIVLRAAEKATRAEKSLVEQQDFLAALERMLLDKTEIETEEGGLTDEEKAKIGKRISEKLDTKRTHTVDSPEYIV